jgi:hypothetical protein
MINKKEKETCCSDKVFSRGRHHHRGSCHNSSAIYGLGIFGALFYFLQNAVTFTAVMVGIFKSIFWPAFVLFKVLTLLNI